MDRWLTLDSEQRVIHCDLVARPSPRDRLIAVDLQCLGGKKVLDDGRAFVPAEFLPTIEASTPARSSFCSRDRPPGLFARSTTGTGSQRNGWHANFKCRTTESLPFNLIRLAPGHAGAFVCYQCDQYAPVVFYLNLARVSFLPMASVSMFQGPRLFFCVHCARLCWRIRSRQIHLGLHPSESFHRWGVAFLVLGAELLLLVVNDF